MKKYIIPVFVLLGAFVTSVKAQSKDELALLKDYLKVEKKDLVRQYMALSAEEDTKFWPIYDAYTADRGKIAGERISTIEDYAKAYTNLTDEQADGLVKRIMKNDQANQKVMNKYYSKVKKVLGATKAAQWLQLEYYLQTIVRAEIQDAIPFIGEIERKKN